MMRQPTPLAMNADIWYMVAEHIKNPWDLIHVAMTCRELYAIYTSDHAWRHFNVYGLEQNILERFVADKSQMVIFVSAANFTQQLVNAIKFRCLPKRLEMIDKQLLWCMLRLVDIRRITLPNDVKLALELLDLFPCAAVESVARELYENREMYLRLLDHKDLQSSVMYELERFVDRNDKELVLKMIQRSYSYAGTASPEIIASGEFRELVSLNPMLLQFGPENLKHDIEFLESCDFSTYPQAIKHTAKDIQADIELVSKLIGAKPNVKFIKYVYKLFGARNTAYIYRNMGAQVASEPRNYSVFRELCPFLYTTKDALLAALPTSRHTIEIPPDLRNDQQVILAALSGEYNYKAELLFGNLSEDTLRSREFRELARRDFDLFTRAGFLHNDVEFLESVDVEFLLLPISQYSGPKVKEDPDLIVHLLSESIAHANRRGANSDFEFEVLAAHLDIRKALLVWCKYGIKHNLSQAHCLITCRPLNFQRQVHGAPRNIKRKSAALDFEPRFSHCHLCDLQQIVDECPQCYRYAPTDIKRNIAFLHSAVKGDGLMLEFAPWHLRRCKAICVTAIRQNVKAARFVKATHRARYLELAKASGQEVD